MQTDNPTISKHGLDLIDKSPLDYYWRYLNPNRKPYVPDKQTIFDQALRCLIFEPSRFFEKYVKSPKIDKRVNEGKAEFAALQASVQANNLIILSASDYDVIQAMTQALENHKTVSLLLSNGNVGMPSLFTEKKSGAVIEFKPHWLTGEIIVNLTSTDDASMGNFQKEAVKFKHYKKAAIQVDALDAAAMVFITVERTEPYKIGIHKLDDRAFLFGREEYIRNCSVYIECLNNGDWPGLPEKITNVSLPEWAYNK